MDQKSKSLFTKLMMMTSSANDGEALVAIRKANAILAEANVNWEQFLAALDQQSRASYMTPPSKRPYQPPQQAQRPTTPWHDIMGDKHTDADQINRFFYQAFARTHPGSSFYEFLHSVHQFWQQRDYLTDAQFQAIKRAAASRR